MPCLCSLPHTYSAALKRYYMNKGGWSQEKRMQKEEEKYKYQRKPVCCLISSASFAFGVISKMNLQMVQTCKTLKSAALFVPFLNTVRPTGFTSFSPYTTQTPQSLLGEGALHWHLPCTQHLETPVLLVSRQVRNLLLLHD